MNTAFLRGVYRKRCKTRATHIPSPAGGNGAVSGACCRSRCLAGVFLSRQPDRLPVRGSRRPDSSLRYYLPCRICRPTMRARSAFHACYVPAGFPPESADALIATPVYAATLVLHHVPGHGQREGAPAWRHRRKPSPESPDKAVWRTAGASARPDSGAPARPAFRGHATVTAVTLWPSILAVCRLYY